MSYQLQRTQRLNCSLEEAWEFFSSPKNLPRITPPDMKFKIMSDLPEENIYKGMLIDYTVAPVLGIDMNWRTEITNVDPNKSFTDNQVKGPYKLWNHFHEFIPNEDGVLVKDTVDYELPLGILGNIAHSLFVRKKLDYIFDYRHQVIEKLFNQKKELL